MDNTATLNGSSSHALWSDKQKLCDKIDQETRINTISNDMWKKKVQKNDIFQHWHKNQKMSTKCHADKVDIGN